MGSEHRIPTGYISQRISSTGQSGAPYFQSWAIEEWFTKHRDIVGSRATKMGRGNGIFDIIVKRQLTEAELREIKKISHPEYYDASKYFASDDEEDD